MNTWLWIGVVVAVAVVVAFVSGIIVRRRDVNKVAYMLDAMDDGEMNFRFQGRSAMSRTLNRIKGILEQHNAASEEASQTKLFRVMTHEIMNTVAPIASLSDALLTEEDIDVKAGLETISMSSKDLIRFVESYRSFMQVAPPVRKPVMVDELMNHVLRLN